MSSLYHKIGDGQLSVPQLPKKSQLGAKLATPSWILLLRNTEMVVSWTSIFEHLE
jgi:hypothetical protein